MRLIELQHAAELTLAAPTILYRVQRQRSKRGAVAFGSLRLAPRGLLLGRFDLLDDVVGYFADAGETAVYETLARREVQALAMSQLTTRVLIAFRTTVPLHLLDLRLHANGWPVLQSLRFEITQGLARDAHDLGYQGIVYRSAQQYGADCFALFGREPLTSLRQVSRAPLVQAESGVLHRAAADAVRGSMIPLVA